MAVQHWVGLLPQRRSRTAAHRPAHIHAIGSSSLAGSNANTNAIDLLKADHDIVKDLFDRFEKAENGQAKKNRKRLGKDVMNEADEEHHVAKVLIAELDDMDGHGDHFDAKFHVLSESVRHHIKEEESEMLPKAKALDIDFDELGKVMLRRKQQLLTNGVMMVAAVHGAGDSPAKAAHRKPRTAVKKR